MYNIVIVEDEIIEVESLERIILQSVDNAIVHKATTGRKAIQLIDDLKSIDLMLVDINIPLPNGKEIIEYLRSTNKDAKVIVTTANDDFDMLRDMLNLRIQDYLLKPVKKSILTETIQKTLGFNEELIQISQQLKKDIIRIIDQNDLSAWNDFTLDIVNNSYIKTKDGIDSRDNVKNFLDTLCFYLDSLNEDYSISCSKLNVLSEDVIRTGLNKNLYPQLIFTLMKISDDIFTYSFKKQSCNIDFINRSKYHIERNIFENITLDNISEKTFVSSCYLSRVFKKSENIGFSSYITKRKINLACALLKFSNLKINIIALDLSWKDSNYFCRIFKKETGLSPSDYRESLV